MAQLGYALRQELGVYFRLPLRTCKLIACLIECMLLISSSWDGMELGNKLELTIAVQPTTFIPYNYGENNTVSSLDPQLITDPPGSFPIKDHCVKCSFPLQYANYNAVMHMLEQHDWADVYDSYIFMWA